MSTVVELAARRGRNAVSNGSPVGLATRHYTPHDISLREPEAVMYWCRHFNTTPEQLVAAVKKVGTNPAIVQLQLRGR
jgi:hypothetical protein